MATKKKMLQAAAGNAGGAGLDITDVFSTYLYDGTGAEQTITNGIDLDGEGGAILTKRRDSTTGGGPWFNDTERGITKYISTSDTSTGGDSAASISAATSTGYTLGGAFSGWNVSAGEYVSWTFRKAPKFFTCVTWTGDGVAGREIAHDLGTTVGSIFVKRTDATRNWAVYHRSRGATKYLALNTTGAENTATSRWNDTEPTSTVFTVGSAIDTNVSGGTYVAYLFAHNDGDGEFGPDADQDIIKCGSYAGNSTIGHTIDLGFEAQWVLVRSTSNLRKWMLYDVMRGMPVSGNGAALYPNSTDAEESLARIGASNVGFQLTSTDSMVNLSGETYIYIAIRRGPLAPPESATEVFEVFETTNTGTASTIGSMGPSDFILNKRTDAAATWRALDRLRGGSMLRTDSTDTETSSGFLEWDKMGGVFVTAAGAPYITNDAQAHWLWKRAPGFFDVQAFTLGSASNREVKHNLAAVPEMIWWKERSDTSYWMFWHKDFTSSQYMSLHLSDAIATSANIWGTSAPTSTGWYMKETAFGGSGNTCISYTFASLPGISKVGSYSGNNSSQTIDCGFTTGARFVLIKASSRSGSWAVWDSARGITAGDDPRLELNSTSAEQSQSNIDVEPHSSGFIIDSTSGEFNEAGETYIFYAIA
jgi:hypothetical protein